MPSYYASAFLWGLGFAVLIGNPARMTLGGGRGLSPAQVMAGYGKLPLRFEDLGQAGSQVRFASRSNGYSLFLTPTEAVFVLRGPSASAGTGESKAHGCQAGATLRMQLAGANPRPEVVGLEELPGRSNYLVGNDPAKWRTHVPAYAKVQYQGVYPGVNLVYYGNQKQLEYDFVVAPGADPKVIQLAFLWRQRRCFCG
jgi:hypothetical protein